MRKSLRIGLRNLRCASSKLVEALPRKQTAQVIGKQVLRSGTSVGANYRAACRAKSRLDIIHKLSIVEEEADESLFWMELLVEAELMRKAKLASLMAEADEIIAMIVSSIKTLRAKHDRIQNPKSKIVSLLLAYALSRQNVVKCI